MGWSESRTRNRIKERKSKINEYVVTEHKKEMDFDNLGKKDIRKVDGIHHYFDISNFASLALEAGEDESKQKKLLQRAHVFRRGLEDVVSSFEALKLQDQNLRTHFLRFKPYNDKNQMADAAVIDSITLNSYVYDVFNNVFPEHTNFRARSGMSLGITYIANIGRNGDRELISLGSAANYGAKLLNNDGSISICKQVYEKLSPEIQKIFTKEKLKNGTEYYLAKQAKWSNHQELRENLKINFNEDKLQKTLEEYKKSLPLSDIEISEARTTINFKDLSESNSKRTHTISIVADIDGFTKLIEEAESNDKVVDLFAIFNSIREELHEVIVNDYNGTVIQHRGDATYAILNLPFEKDKKSKRCSDGTSLALALQSSMKIINEIFSAYKDLHLSIGLGSSLTMYSRVGKHGDRHLLVIGKGNEESESNQQMTAGKDTTITKNIYDLLEEDLAEQFAKNETVYTAYNRTLEYDTERVKSELIKNIEVITSSKRIEVIESTQNKQPHANQGNHSGTF